MNRKLYFIIFMALAIGVPLTAQEEPIGLRVRAFGGIVPWGQHFPATNTIFGPSFGASAGLEVLYRLPLADTDLDVGIGAKFFFERSVALGGGQRGGYSVLPIYATVHLPFFFPDSNETWLFYLAGRLGYSFFIFNGSYQRAIATAATTPGNFYGGVGLGLGFIPIDLLQIFVELGYEGNLFVPAGGINDNRLDVSVGIAFRF